MTDSVNVGPERLSRTMRSCLQRAGILALVVALVLWPATGVAAATGQRTGGETPIAWQSGPQPSHSGSPGPVVGGESPTDPDGDGLYEDVNGDGRVTLADAQALLVNLESVPTDSFDFDRSDNLTVADVETLFDLTTDIADDDSDLDGLPDKYERTVTETDPTDSDSDSGLTSGDDADDGVPDGTEDFDGDGHPAKVEYALGTSPRTTDTDGDGLNDSFEARTTNLSATATDSDGDGTSDAETDHDGDGLDTGEELTRGTDPFDSDTDGDGASDGEELEAGTDPLVADTDSDGVADGPETAVGSDPTSADSDGDGTPDSAEAYSRTVSDDETGATVNVTGSADAAGSITVSEAETVERDGGALDKLAVSPVLDVQTEASIESATVTMPYVSDDVEDPSSLAIVRFSEGNLTVLDSEVNPTEGTVTAETDHFSHLAIIPYDPPAEPKPALSVLTESPTPGQEVRLEPRNFPNDVEQYHWTFDDGTTGRGPTAVHTYDEAGSYTVELAAVTGGGERVTTTATVSVEEADTSNSSDDADTADTAGLVVKQGGETYDVSAVSGSESVDSFYGHNENGEFSANNQYVKSGAARVLVYNGPNGPSLVVVLGPPGGSATMSFEGVPASASWVVTDDGKQGPTDSYSGTSKVDWSWNQGRTDGGAIRGGLDGGSITVSYSGQQTLEFVSADGTRSLDATQPFTVDFTGGSVDSGDETDNQTDDDTDETGDQSMDDTDNRTSGDDNSTVTAAFEVNTTNITTDDVVEFDATDASGPIEYYDWEFDDGSAGFGETTTYSFREPGTYEVTLTVHEGIEGAKDSTTLPLDVEPAPESGPNNSTNESTDSANDSEEMVDSDDDGLPDELEEEGVPVQYNIGPESPATPPVTATIQLDPNDSDTDGDGVPDGYEIEANETFTGLDGTQRYGVRSLPNKTDSEGDSVPDDVENETELRPLNPDTDGDSLEDGFERDGIPVVRWYNYSTVGESANTTSVLPGPDDDAVKTDPLNADTDGDGIDDGTEVGSETVDQQGFTLYQLRSDPTDPNTDDTGLSDSTERQIGSDPTSPEYASVQITAPVTGKQGCVPETNNGLVRDCTKDHYELTGDDSDGPSHVLRPAAEFNGNQLLSGIRKPNWLSDVNVEDGKSYYLVKVTVETNYENVPADARPDYVRFVKTGGLDGDLTSPVPVELSDTAERKVVPLVIETGNDFGVKNIGNLKARIDVEGDSVIDRGDGGNAVVETQTNLVILNEVQGTSADGARRLVEEATKTWAQSTIAAVAPTGGAVAKATVGGGAGVAAKLFVDGVATLSGVDDDGLLSKPGQDELIAKAIVAEGTVPAYLNRNINTPPISAATIVWYRES